MDIVVLTAQIVGGLILVIAGFSGAGKAEDQGISKINFALVFGIALMLCLAGTKESWIIYSQANRRGVWAFFFVMSGGVGIIGSLSGMLWCVWKTLKYPGDV